jgi:hypothetical protein
MTIRPSIQRRWREGADVHRLRRRVTRKRRLKTAERKRGRIHRSHIPGVNGLGYRKGAAVEPIDSSRPARSDSHASGRISRAVHGPSRASGIRPERLRRVRRATRSRPFSPGGTVSRVHAVPARTRRSPASRADRRRDGGGSPHRSPTRGKPRAYYRLRRRTGVNARGKALMQRAIAH